MGIGIGIDGGGMSIYRGDVFDVFILFTCALILALVLVLFSVFYIGIGAMVLALALVLLVVVVLTRDLCVQMPSVSAPHSVLLRRRR